MRTKSAMHPNKLLLLEQINENKALLFTVGGRRTGHLQDERRMAWRSMGKVAYRLGVLDKRKDYKYLRDTVWQNWKKRTIQKVQGIAARNELNNEDYMIMKILGLKTPGEPHSAQPSPAYCNVPLNPLSKLEISYEEDDDVRQAVGEPALKRRRSDEANTVPVYDITGEDSDTEPFTDPASNKMGLQSFVDINMQRRSHLEAAIEAHERERAAHLAQMQAHEEKAAQLKQLQESSSCVPKRSREELEHLILEETLKNLERDNYLKELEICKKERELQLPPSEFTRGIYEM